MQKEDNYPLARCHTFKLPFLQSRESGSKRQTLCQWWRSENSIDEVVQTTVKIFFRGMDTCFSLKFKFWKGNAAIKRNDDYVEKKGYDPQRTSFVLTYDTYSCVGNYPCTKEKSITFQFTLVYIYIYIYIYIIIDCIFSIFDSFHFLNCLMIAVLLNAMN